MAQLARASLHNRARVWRALAARPPRAAYGHVRLVGLHAARPPRAAYGNVRLVGLHTQVAMWSTGSESTLPSDRVCGPVSVRKMYVV